LLDEKINNLGFLDELNSIFQIRCINVGRTSLKNFVATTPVLKHVMVLYITTS